ncbi:S-layer homology domain-containing protein [Microbacterium sp. CH-015]|uniref:S-layer homology domain-containing protein n=1 Tax=Microbacterium sp. CH-015 TaxID=3406734 RepID=UPI003C75CD2C
MRTFPRSLVLAIAAVVLGMLLPTAALAASADVRGTSVIAPAVDNPAPIFTDTNGHVFENEIAWLASAGVTRGWEVSPGMYEFRPQAQILRGEMAAFLYRLSGSPNFDVPTTSPFIDVSTDFVFYREIAWLAEQGISAGWSTPAGAEFRPFLSTSRDVMARFLHRFQLSPAFDAGVSPFRDVTGSTVFATEILWLASEGISTGWNVGYGCYEYRPYQNVTRSEMAAFLYRMENGGTTPLVGNTCAPPPSPLVSDHVTSGAFCGQARLGWYGYTVTGVLMRCTQLPGETQPRWRQA